MAKKTDSFLDAAALGHLQKRFGHLANKTPSTDGVFVLPKYPHTDELSLFSKIDPEVLVEHFEQERVISTPHNVLPRYAVLLKRIQELKRYNANKARPYLVNSRVTLNVPIELLQEIDAFLEQKYGIVPPVPKQEE